MLKSMINPVQSGKTILFKIIFLLLGISFFISSIVFAGPNENAGIVFDLNATTYCNQNLTSIPSQPSGTYIRLDVYCTGVQNLDTFEFEVIYDPTELAYVSASATNPITYEPNILTANGGTALGWMIDSSTPGLLSLAYTLAGTDTLEAPEGEGLIADIVFQALVATHGTLTFGDVDFYDSFVVMDIITDKGVAMLYEFGNIDGNVTNSNTGEPIEGAIVFIGDFSDTTGTDGTYLLEYVTLGIHDITCTSYGYYDTVDVVEVLGGQTLTVDFVLEPFRHGKLNGTVTEAGTTDPIDSVLVTATPAKLTTYTNSVGYYIIEELVEGIYYNVTFEKAGHNVGQVDCVEVFEDDTTTVNYTMKSPELTYTPTSFTFITEPGDSVVDTLYVENIGTGPVDFDIDIEYIYDKSRQTILCVDRDGSFTTGYTDDWPYFQAALDAAGYSYTYYEVDISLDGPDLATMQLYDVIIWFSGEAWGAYGHDCMTDNDEINLAAYLDGGGTLFLSSQDYLYASYQSAGNFSAGQFPYDYLGIRSVTQDNWLIGTSQGGPPTGTIEGVAGSLADGYTFDVQDIYSTKNGLYIDWLTDFVADGLFNVTSPTPEGICGIQYDAMTFRTVFTPASFAAITNTTIQKDLIDAIIQWLSPSPWLTVDPDAGTIDPLTTTSLTLTANSEGLENNTTYNAIIHVNTVNPHIGAITLPATITVGEIGVTGEPEILVTELYGNFPNPFSSSTIIKFSLKEATHVKLSVYNILGQLVNRLIDKDMVVGADYQVKWGGTSNDKKLANGIYFYKLETGNKTFLKKMILMK